ncbi:hypothetical protein ACKWTF_016591 [Chironomus riparius]
MGSPYRIAAIYMCYVVIVTKILPRLIENWKPIDYSKYTFIHVLILYARSFYFVYNETYLWFFEYNWNCQACSQPNSLLSILEVKLAHEFVISKFIYTVQSFIVVLSKRTDEYTTYVWIHHSVFPLMLWTCVNYYPGGHTLFIHYINASEHFCQMSVQMVYLIFSLKSMRKYLKMIYTFMHIIQFLLIMWHSSQLYFLNDCRIPKLLGLCEISGILFLAYCYLYYLRKREIGKKARELAAGTMN